MEDKRIVEVIEFTDPVCVWCWGSEPFLRKLEARYEDQVKVSFIMGGLVKDIREFYDPYNHIGRGAEKSNKQVASHWLASSERHGMPIRTEGFNLFADEYPSTYPQNIAYKAAQMEDEVLANKFLRRIREASEAEAKQTSRLEVLIELASEVGLDISKFIARFEDGTAEAAFNDDLSKVYSYNVQGFPTFLIRYGEKEVVLRGWQDFDAFKSVITSLSGGSISDTVLEKSEDKVLKFIKKYAKVAPVEIKEAFEYSSKELSNVLEGLKEKNLINLTEAGNGYFISASKSPLSCDPVTGVCRI
jgi:predicted DsbA family dithiol-disulfide isomerase